MTADDFIAWAMQQPARQRHQLVAGEVVVKTPPRAGHARAKGQIYAALRQAVRAAGLSCETYPDGMSVRVDAMTVLEPDAMVRCGRPLEDNAVEVPDPVIVVEVVSPWSGRRDAGAKLEGYFRLPSVSHYLIVTTGNRSVIHHRRDAAGDISTHIVREGTIRLDPPGIELTEVFQTD